MEIKLSVIEDKHFDVAVIGGGTAGCFAAISSKRAGASTVLIEKNGMLGGTITCANVNFPGLFFAWGKQIISGPCWESIERTILRNGAKMPPITKTPKKHWQEQIRLNRFLYASVLDEMCCESGVDVRLHTMLGHASEEKEGVTLIVAAKEGLRRIHADIAIDATADANLTTVLGYPCEESDILQPATLVNDLTGYHIDEIDKEAVINAAKKALAQNQLPHELNPNSLYRYLCNRRIDIHVYCEGASTSQQKTKLEMDARKKLLYIVEFLRKIPNLENLQISFVAEECGVRETKRIIGEGTVTKEDYITGTVYDDAVCYSFYPLDLHVMNGIEQVFLAEDVIATIPYKALVPKGSKRLLTAGRCISSDALANSALRVQAPCMATGQAAGCAAAIASSAGLSVQDVPYEKLCHELTKQGAIVPEKE